MANFVAITPGENHQNLINFNDTNDAKFYKTISKPSEIKFDGKGKNVKAFLQRIVEHAVGYGGMKNLFTIPDPITMGVVVISLRATVLFQWMIVVFIYKGFIRRVKKRSRRLDVIRASKWVPNRELPKRSQDAAGTVHG
jgi:hypothetical protein